MSKYRILCLIDCEFIHFRHVVRTYNDKVLYNYMEYRPKFKIYNEPKLWKPAKFLSLSKAEKFLNSYTKETSYDPNNFILVKV